MADVQKVTQLTNMLGSNAALLHLLRNMFVSQLPAMTNDQLDQYIVVMQQYNQNIVPAHLEAAVEFGVKIIVEFVVENISFGITQSGKTRAVSDYLINLERYCRTGSLYAAVEELQALRAAPIPEELAPFITDVRLALYENKLKQFLGMP